MKYLVLLALVLGFAHGNKEEEASLTELLPLDSIVSSIHEALLKNNEGPMETMRAVTKVIKIKDIVDKFVGPIATIAHDLVVFANYIAAIVGLVFLIIYLICGGDFKALLGTGRSLSTWSSFDFNPAVETFSEILSQALEKYDESFSG